MPEAVYEEVQEAAQTLLDYVEDTADFYDALLADPKRLAKLRKELEDGAQDDSAS